MGEERVVGMGTFLVASNPASLVCLGLGSCVAVILHDRIRRIGGMAHAMLPWFHAGRDLANPAKYVDMAIYLMVDEMIEAGANPRTLRARLVGGAQVFNFAAEARFDVGKQNVEAARATLTEERISVDAEDVGGSQGRSVTFRIREGDVLVERKGQPTQHL